MPTDLIADPRTRAASRADLRPNRQAQPPPDTAAAARSAEIWAWASTSAGNVQKLRDDAKADAEIAGPRRRSSRRRLRRELARGARGRGSPLLALHDSPVAVEGNLPPRLETQSSRSPDAAHPVP